MTTRSKAKFATAITAAVASVLGVAAPASAVPAAPVGVEVMAPRNCTSYWTTSKANMRDRPTLSGKVIGSIPKGTCLRWLNASFDKRDVYWIKTTYNGKTGWVSAMNLDTL